MQEPNGRQAYRTSVRPIGQGGIVSLVLAANSQRQALVPGRVYNWTFSVICDFRSPDENQVVDGGIQRVLPDANLNSRLQRATPSQRVFLYAQAGYWENTLATLADLRRNRPNDSELRSDWLDLLQSVGLQNLAGVPLLPCC